MEFSKPLQALKRKPQDAHSVNNLSIEEFQTPQKTEFKYSKLSQARSQKGGKTEHTKKKINECANTSNKRLHCDKEPNSADKKCKFEENLLEDTLFDDINFTQILSCAEPAIHRSKATPLRTLSENSLQAAISQNKKTLRSHSDDSFHVNRETTDVFQHYFSDAPKLTLSQMSQLFENSQVMNQIETILSESESQGKIPSVKSENMGDLLNVTNRGKVESFFNQIEHSVCALGTDTESSEVVTKILETLISSSEAAAHTNEKNVTLSDINASFASALKQVLLGNVSSDITLVKNLNTSVEAQNLTFTEMGPFYGLPLKVKELIKLYKGIDELYDWQDECLNLDAIKKRKNLIYALPTSGGKTLVAEILMLREVICNRRNALFILPYVAIVQEKVWALSPFAVALDFLVEEYAASKGVYPPRKRRRKRSIYIATIEKAHGLLNSLIETERMKEIGLIVVDELHLLGEQGRGSTLEALLTKIMFIKADVQVVGMSATIGNINDLCKFLDAETYSQNFRPVELVEYVKCGSEVAKINYSSKEEELLTVVRVVNHVYPGGLNSIDPDKLGALVMEVVPQDSCLIFCPSKKNCENVAYLLCRVVSRKLLDYKKEEKAQVKHALKDEGGSLCKIFNVSIQLGIAYHHSGLTNEERRVIEDAFRAGILSVICCTSTLAAGVNLPAKRVILRQPYVGRDFISLSKYKQMVGRAGRAGLGETGDSILICSNPDLPKVKKLLLSPMDEALSSMHESEGKGLRHLLLSCISLGIATTRFQLQEVSKKTLLYMQSERLSVNVKKLTDKVIADLFKLGALQEADLTKQENSANCDVSVRMETSLANTSLSNLDGTPTNRKKRIVLKNDTKLVISKLGCAAIKGNFELRRAHQLYDDLHEAQKSLVLLDSLHLLYLVTPYEIADQIKPNKNDYYNIYCKLGPNELQTARILGLSEGVAVKLLSNQQIKNVPERVLNRFYLALMLYDLWNAKPVYEVSEKYQINRGIVQNLMTSSASFASNVVHFCEELEEFWTFAHLLKGMSQRLAHCCIRELLPLMELPAVKQSRARQLYNAGYQNIRSVAAASPENLMESIEYMPRRVAKQLIAAAKMLLLEKVENLREEAEDVLDGVENPKPFLNQTVLQ